ncbi:hypothetical protein ROE7235_02992 [Roseibaca ekhonensis]|uniref:Uncharacterized protein n=1 Tax=Roseinatronobacter ekhonensis TaxID=254356 RepID=A0A3B0MC39_9RHOB|nr:hypothetical protein [Roseibaca ekhonensis]SUZ33223.1 hypothetical protein ROE7235_02992 [Roseibaca ekhonensis]
MRDTFQDGAGETAKPVYDPQEVRMDVVRLDSFLAALKKAAEEQDRKVVPFPERRSDKT